MAKLSLLVVQYLRDSSASGTMHEEEIYTSGHPAMFARANTGGGIPLAASGKGAGYLWLLVVREGYLWLLVVREGYLWLLVVREGYLWLLVVREGYLWLLVVREGYPGC